MNFKRLKLMRAAARVKRVHTTHVNHSQTVGEHTFGVLCLAREIISPRAMSGPLVQAILTHDVTEGIRGDPPGPVGRNEHLKKGYAELDALIYAAFDTAPPELDPWEAQVLAFCDKIEFAMYALEEVQSGNALMMPRVRNSLANISNKGLYRCTPAAAALLGVMERRAAEYPIDLGEDCTHGYHG